MWCGAHGLAGGHSVISRAHEVEDARIVDFDAFEFNTEIGDELAELLFPHSPSREAVVADNHPVAGAGAINLANRPAAD